MTVLEKILENVCWRAAKSVRVGWHAGFGPPGKFLEKSRQEKLKTLTEPPHKKVPRMLDAADKDFWKE